MKAINIESYEDCIILLKRISWRLQYKARVKIKKELPINENIIGLNSLEKINYELFVEELLNSLSKKGKDIIKMSVINRFTEKEIALKYGVQRQAINRCKKKNLLILRKKIKDSACF